MLLEFISYNTSPQAHIHTLIHSHKSPHFTKKNQNPREANIHKNDVKNK